MSLEIFTADQPLEESRGAVGSASKKNTITGFKQGVKDKNRINVFMDGKFSFSLTLTEFSDANLKTGQILSEAEITKLKSTAEFSKLYQCALEYALTRPHSEKEIRDYLNRKAKKRELDQKRYDAFKQRLKEDPEYRAKVREIRADTREKNAKIREKTFEEDNRYEYRGSVKSGLPSKPGAAITKDAIEQVIERLKKDRALDDAEFARYFVANRNRYKGTSLRKLKLELKSKGIADDLIEAAFSADEYGETLRDETEEIKKVIMKKRAKYAFKQLTPEEQKAQDQKLIQYLLRQGFSYDLVQTSLREMD